MTSADLPALHVSDELRQLALGRSFGAVHCTVDMAYPRVGVAADKYPEPPRPRCRLDHGAFHGRLLSVDALLRKCCYHYGTLKAVRSETPRQNVQGLVAQRSEQGTHNPSVVGSIPTEPTRTPPSPHHLKGLVSTYF